MNTPTPRRTSQMVIDNYALPEVVEVRLWDGGSTTISAFHVVGGYGGSRRVIVAGEDRSLHPEDEASLLAAVDLSDTR